MKRFFIRFLFLILILFVVWLSLNIVYYPRIVRSAYLREPSLLVRAIYLQTFPGPGKSKREVLANSLHEKDQNLHLLKLVYLDSSPRNDRIIRDRYFSLLSKVIIKTNESLFWEFKAPNRHALVEYRTGRVVFDYRDGTQVQPYFPENPEN